MANRKERRAAARNKENEGSEAITPDEVLGGGEDGLPAGDAMPFPDHEEDALFKAQMQVLNVLLGQLIMPFNFIISLIFATVARSETF